MCSFLFDIFPFNLTPYLQWRPRGQPHVSMWTGRPCLLVICTGR